MSSQEIDRDSYGDFHKIVLQGVMAAGYLDLKGVKGLFNAACDYIRCSQEERTYKTSMVYVQQIVQEINGQIKPLNMIVKSVSCELSGKKYFIFMLTVEKSIMKQQLTFSKIEIDMFQKCMDGMLRKYNNYSLPFHECINILREFDPRASLTVAETFVNKMIDIHYFTKYMTSPTDFDVTLGVRCIREFEPLLVDLYRDVVKSCSLCKMILLHGYRCPKCKIIFHRPCYTKYVAVCKSCKNCKEPWDQERKMLIRSRETDVGTPDEQTPISQTVRPIDNDRPSSQPGPSGVSNSSRNRRATHQISDSESSDGGPSRTRMTNGRSTRTRTRDQSDNESSDEEPPRTRMTNGRSTRTRTRVAS